jgi:YesN/AraC family two-component response regulator
MTSPGPVVILFLDDEDNIINGIKRIFRSEPVKLLTTTDPVLALEWVKAEKPKVVISDFRMESMNGLDFIHHVQSLSPSSVRVIMSGYAEDEKIHQALKDKVLHYFISKPCGATELKQAIKSYIEFSQTLAQ